MPARCPALSSSIPARPACAGDLVELLEASGEALVQTDPRGVFTFLNDAARALLGPGAGAAGAARATDFAPPATRRRLAAEVIPALRTAGRWAGELRWRDAQGGELLLRMTVVAHRGHDGLVDRCTAMLRDLSAAALASHRLERQAAVMHAITEAIPATVVVVDVEGRYRFANGAFARQCGLAHEQIIGRRAAEVLGAEEVARRKPFMQRAFQGEAVDFTLDYPGPGGTTHLALSCIPLKLAGAFDGFVGISQNVTLQRREQDRLIHLAERDPLTGLLNRAGFEHRIERLATGDTAATLALLYIDLDHFKPVNDRFGHLAGDRLLQLFAERLSRAVRATDSVARLGGDEFAVLLDGIRDTALARAVGEKVVAAACEAFEVEGHSLRIGASVGVAFGIEGSGGWRDLVGRADAMLYRAKSEGRGRCACAEAQGA